MTQASKTVAGNCGSTTSVITDPTDVISALEQEFRTFAVNLSKFKLERNGDRIDRLALLILGTLAHQGPSRLSAIADKSGFDPSTASRQVSALEQAGLLERTPDPEDRRAVLLKASPKGKRLLQRLQVRRRKQIERILDGWTTDEIATFTHLLGRLNEATEHHHEVIASEMEQELNHG